MSGNGHENLPATTSSALALTPAFSLAEAQRRYVQVHEFVESIMTEGSDYGMIPGTEKKTLLKPGAEKLTSFFGLTTKIIGQEVVEDWDGKDHGGESFFYYLYRLGLYHGERLIAEAEGSANSRENRYRWRWVREDEIPSHLDKKGLAVRGGKTREMGFAVDKGETAGKWGKPEAYWQKFRDAIAGGSAQRVKIETSKGIYDGWEIEDYQYRVPNEDIFSLVNTIQKIAYKRAFVAVTLVATNASDYFSQDLEDLAEDGVIDATFRVVEPERRAESKPRPQAAPAFGPFWREANKINVTSRSAQVLFGTENMGEYSKGHTQAHLDATLALLHFAAEMDMSPTALCEALQVQSLAKWVDDDPAEAVEIAKNTVNQAISAMPQPEQAALV